MLNDWAKVKEKNRERLERLNLPEHRSSGKVFIFDKYCPYSLDVIEVKPSTYTNEFGIHGTYAAQVVKLVAGDNVELHGSGFDDFDKIVDYCIKNNIRVINSSIVCSYTKERDNAIKRYGQWGGIWVSSAGNNNHKKIHFPGSSKYTIAVSATNSEDSNGPEIDITTDSYWYVRNKEKGYFTPFNGTSCAAPVIAGVARIVLDLYPHWKLEDFRRFLKENSRTDLESLEEFERFFSFSENFGEKNNMEIKFKIDSPIYEFNGEKKKMDTAAFIKDDRTFVPIRFVAEALGLEVHWDNDKREVTIGSIGSNSIRNRNL